MKRMLYLNRKIDLEFDSIVEIQKFLLFSEVGADGHSGYELEFFEGVYRFLSHYPNLNSDIRVQVFKSNYLLSSRFLKFCMVYVTSEFLEYLERGNLDRGLFDRVSEHQVLSMLIKYINCGFGRDLYWCDTQYAAGSCGWVDSEFDWLVYQCIHFRKREISAYAKVAPYSISGFNWWDFVDLNWFQFNLAILPFKFDFGKLVFDYGRKFSGDSTFRAWQVRKMVSYPSLGVGVSSRFMFSFQNQFNYSDIPALDFHISNFQHIHIFNPIFKEMYDLPFLIPQLRPGFNDLFIIYLYNSYDKLHYTSVYSIKGFEFWTFIFDKYLYNHARLLLTLPYRYSSLAEAQYSVNFMSMWSTGGGFYNHCSSYLSRYYNTPTFQPKFVRFMFNSVIVASGLDSFVELDQYRSRFVNYYFRQKLIIQIILNCWVIFSNLQKWFESINYYFYQVFAGSERLTYLHGYHDMIGTFIGPLNPIIFDRLTRRVLMEFFKVLSSNSYLIILLLFRVSEDQRVWFDVFIRTHTLFDNGYENALVELEIGYRGRNLNSVAPRNHLQFSTFNSEIFEQLHDYELWLYVYFSGWYNLVSSFS